MTNEYQSKTIFPRWMKEDKTNQGKTYAEYIKIDSSKSMLKYTKPPLKTLPQS